MDWEAQGWQWLGSLLIAVVTAFATVQLSLRKFRAEKLWEKRLAAYVEVAAGLHDMLRSLGRWIDRELEGREFTEEYEAKLKQRYEEARRKLEQVRAIGALLLPATIVTALTKAEGELTKDRETYFDSINESYGAIKAALDRVNEIGRKDLGVE